MLFSVTRWRLVVSRGKEVLMRLPLNEGEYLLGNGADADLRLLDVEGALRVSADEVEIEVAGKPHALHRGPAHIGAHTLVAERTHFASGQTKSLLHTTSESAGDVVIVTPDGKVYTLGDDELRIGTDSSCHIRVSSGYVSQRHAALFRKEKRVFVRDLASKNGTFVNDTRVVEAEMMPPASLRIGDLVLKVQPDISGPKRTRIRYIVGDCAAMQTLIDQIERYASKRVPCLITGETGTGKELVARALYEEGPRAKLPFVVVNCGAIASDALESELFGHAKGYQGGDKRVGAFMRASNGTLFLDEIGDLPVSVQASLLRAIESGAVKALGGDAPQHTDVRVIAATHKNLRDAVRRGTFRADLFHRLDALSIELPPLRDRPGDIALLAQHFLKTIGPSDRALALAPDALRALQAHPFAGNVRELRNAITRGILEVGRDGIVRAADLGLASGDNLVVSGKAQALSRTERDAIIHAIRAANGSRLSAAKALGIARSTLYRKLEDHSISEEEIAGIKP